jgi:hypothetical protein
MDPFWDLRMEEIEGGDVAALLRRFGVLKMTAIPVLSFVVILVEKMYLLAMREEYLMVAIKQCVQGCCAAFLGAEA